MQFIDLFAGVGGFRLALEALGNDCVFSSEINEKCRTVYKKNFGETPVGDIRKVGLDEIPNFDILTAGFPCQPFSLCGKKEGFLDETRGTLFFDIAEILRNKQPKMFILENVKGIITHDNGKTIETIEKCLKDIGYTIYSTILDTYDFGIPQYRKRWFCVGMDKDIQFQFPVGKKRGSTLQEIINKNHFDERLLISDSENKRIDYHFRKHNQTERVKHSNTHCDPKSKKGRYGIYSYLKPDNALRFYTGDAAKSQIQDDYYVSLDSVAPTLIATRAPKLWDLRRHLSVTECQRLQGFGENFDFSDVSIKVAKRQLGNSVTVTVVLEIARNMLEYYKKSVPINYAFRNKSKVKEKQLQLC